MRCVTTSYGKVSGKAAQYRYWQPAIYETTTTKAGTEIWAYVRHEGTARRSPNKAEQEARDLAASLGLPYVANVRHNARVAKQGADR